MNHRSDIRNPEERQSWHAFISEAHTDYVRALQKNESVMVFHSIFSSEVEMRSTGISVNLKPLCYGGHFDYITPNGSPYGYVDAELSIENSQTSRD